MPDSLPLPANSTKHLPLLQHPLPHDNGIVFPLRQISSEGGTGTGTTGTTLWLGAQVLATYLNDTLPPSTGFDRKQCLDLGSGVGYLPLCMASWGWDVIATDIEPVVSSVLRPNIEDGLYAFKSEAARRGKSSSIAGSIEVRELDWMDYIVAPGDDSDSTSSDHSPVSPSNPLNGGYVDLILTTDTLYTPSLTIPLWSTLSSLASSSRARHPKAKCPELILALENRDPRLISEALEVGRQKGWVLKRVADTRVQKAVEKAGWGWGRAEWDGVEVWKGRLP